MEDQKHPEKKTDSSTPAQLSEEPAPKISETSDQAQVDSSQSQKTQNPILIQGQPVQTQEITDLQDEKGGQQPAADQEEKKIENMQGLQTSLSGQEQTLTMTYSQQDNCAMSQDDCHILYRFHLSFQLLNIFRSFKHENHQFTKRFIEDIYVHLFFFKGTQQGETFDQYANEHGELTMQQIVLQIHYVISSIANLEDLINKIEPNTTEKIAKLDSRMINNTNILNTHAILDMRETIDHDYLNLKQRETKPHFLENVTFAITVGDIKDFNKESNTIYISYEYLALAVMSKGKLDAYLTSHVANKLNKCFGLNLYHVLFAFAKFYKSGDLTSVYTENYARGLVEISEKHRNLTFNKKIYGDYVRELVKYRPKQHYDSKSLDKLLDEISQIVYAHIISRNLKLNDYIEKLLIGMLGHSIKKVRDQSIVLLNILYDGVDWQKDAAFNPVIKTVGQKFVINYLVESQDGAELCILIKAFLFIPNCQQNVLSYHKPSVKEYSVVNGKRFVSVTMDLGKFTRCGYFDWRLVRMLKDGTIQTVFKIENIFKNQPKHLFHSKSFTQEEFEKMAQGEKQVGRTKPVQGRFIVHPKITQDLQLHEVIVDYQNAVTDESDRLIKRGNFKTVMESFDEYKTRGCNAIYLMGALERDNGVNFDTFSGQPSFIRPDASPLAVTSKDTPNTMLGGATMFKQVTKRAQELGILILVDCLTRVSSSRMHKKYRKQILTTLDSQGKRVQVYGSDGRAVYFEDTTLLNFRKKKTWNLFFDEIINFVKQYNIQGFHLDNGQSWPQIYKIDENEMYRRESDQEPAYTVKQIFEGTIVDLSEESGYWNSSLKNIYPNPFIKRICQKLWQRFPEFLIISECWGKVGGFEAREYNLIQSGAIPRLFKLPIAICQFFGQTLKKDGTMIPSQRKNVNSFKRWYELYNKNLPSGSITVQSSTYHTWPYPALLYKKGTWAAVDLFFFLPDIPMTIIGEKEGKATKVKGCNFFAAISQEPNYQSQNEEIQEIPHEEDEDDDLQELDMAKHQNVPIGLMHASKSGRHLALQQVDNSFFDKEQFTTNPTSGFGFNSYDQKQIYDVDQHGSQVSLDHLAGTGAQETDQSDESGHQKNHFSSNKKTNSYLKLQATDNQDNINLINVEGYEFIVALKNIHKHYEHRRALRNQIKSLRRGKFISLLAEHMYGWHTHVLPFARFTKKEFTLIIINFNDGPVDGHVNLKSLGDCFPDYKESNIVIELSNVLQPHDTDPNNLYFVGEFIDGKIPFHLEFFQTSLFQGKIYCNNFEMQQQAQQHSLQRLIERLNEKIPAQIHSNDIAERIYLLTAKTATLKDFINGFSCIYSNFLKNIDIGNLINLMKSFQQDFLVKNKLFTFFYLLLEKSKEIAELPQKLQFYQPIKDLIQNNRMKEIVIAPPEFGNYTKTGGLGVMTDELSKGLADLGENVLVITPWYESCAKKSPNLLEKNGIKFLYNIDIYLGNEKQVIGVHYGVVNKVELYFLHNAELFFAPYEGQDPTYIMRSITLYGKGVLEVLCKIQVFPDLIITNDWYSALIPAYIRNKTFGNVFQHTKTYHIIHNFHPSYEGRLYPKEGQGHFGWIHELPDIFFVDPYWKKLIVNPSRCALMNCDNWGTVSHSYKYEIINTSPLSPLLSQFKNAFSYPNGIRKNERMALIKQIAPSHQQAKAKLQKKYFKYEDPDIPLFGFVGRISEQKGVKLILGAFESLVSMGTKKIQVIVGGKANYQEDYGKECAIWMKQLTEKYPAQFYSNPDAFFEDGPLVNLGCDFGLMPSEFEPGGIVQHEFFIAETPVIANKTGGLQDTVIEYNPKANKGSGFLMQKHTAEQLVSAIQRAIKIYKNPEQYEKLRKSTPKAVIDVDDVSRAYAAEFYRMFNKHFLDHDLIKTLMKGIEPSFSLKDYQPQQMVKNKNSRIVSKQMKIENRYKKIIQLHQEDPATICTFVFRPQKGQLPKSLYLAGSWDNFKHKFPLKYNNLSREWVVTLNLVPGEYFYKFIIDDEWMCNQDLPMETDIYGNINNYIKV